MPTKIDVVSSTVQYIGSTALSGLAADPVWSIIKITVTGDDTDIEKPVGITPKKGVWNDRTTYTYG